MQVLIAPNAFKNSLSASRAAEAICAGIQLSGLNCVCNCFPIADGGNGTGALLIEHCKGNTLQTPVHDPLGRVITASYGLIDENKTAVIELADASGIHLLQPKEYNPLQASTFGTGELIMAALGQQVKKIILCVGGSATVDGGTGLLQALGVVFLNKYGQAITNLPADLISVEHIDLSGLPPNLQGCTIKIICDVDNVLLGEKGAAAIFGPQKGATDIMIPQLEAGLNQLRKVVLKQTGIDMNVLTYGGAAGGVAASLAALLQAQLVNGIEEFLSLTHFDNALQNADLVITGEGSLDEQTLQGKGPYGVACKARKKGIPVWGLAGKIPTPVPDVLKLYFDKLICINQEPFNNEEALKHTYENLKKTAFDLGKNLQTQKPPSK